MLFDDSERTDASPAGPEEDTFTFLNRVDQPYWARVREELERWYAAYPDVDRKDDLRNRFRQSRPNQHFGAWWELYLHHLFRCLGFEVEVDPPVLGGTPDFRMRRESDSFLIEATTSFSGIVDEGRHPPSEAAILAAIETVRNPDFTVWVEIESAGQPEAQPRVDQIAQPLESWLSGLDYEDERKRGIFDGSQLSLETRGWKLRFRALPVPPESRGRADRAMVGAGPSMTGWVNDRDKLASALARKGAKYRPDEPLVVAVLVMSSGTMDNEDIESALLGPVVYPVDPENPGLGQPYRQRNGFWTRGREPRHTRVSAVLIGNNIVPTVVSRTWPQLWPNPWAARPLELRLPFPRGLANREGGARYEEAAGSPYEVLALPQDWPGPDKPFSKPWTRR